MATRGGRSALVTAAPAIGVDPHGPAERRAGIAADGGVDVGAAAAARTPGHHRDVAIGGHRRVGVGVAGHREHDGGRVGRGGHGANHGWRRGGAGAGEGRDGEQGNPE